MATAFISECELDVVDSKKGYASFYISHDMIDLKGWRLSEVKNLCAKTITIKFPGDESMA